MANLRRCANGNRRRSSYEINLDHFEVLVLLQVFRTALAMNTGQKVLSVPALLGLSRSHISKHVTELQILTIVYLTVLA